MTIQINLLCIIFPNRKRRSKKSAKQTYLAGTTLRESFLETFSFYALIILQKAEAWYNKVATFYYLNIKVDFYIYLTTQRDNWHRKVIYR